MKYNGINATMQSVVQFAAPAVAGAVLSVGTFRSALLIDILTAWIGMGVSPYFMLYLVMMFVYSISLAMIQTAVTTIIQEKAESSIQGRVFGLMGAMYSGFLPVGMAVFGPLADVLPLQGIMVGSGIALVFVTVYLQAGAKLIE